MQRSELLTKLDIGNSVAEFDKALDRYFVRTGPFLDFVADRYDIVSGDKGTGKSAIFRIISEQRGDFDELKDIDLLPAFNIGGQPVFYELTRSSVLTEGEYVSLWKAYVLSVVGNYLLATLGAESEDLRAIQEILELGGVDVGDYRPESVFQRLRGTLKGFMKPKEIEGSVSVLENGLPILSGKIVPDYGEETDDGGYIPYDYALQRLEAALAELGISVWVVFDRLDEAFQGAPEHEVPALRALLRTFLDLTNLEHVRMKLFLRNDLFDRVTAGGFVNLSHVNARRLELSWSSEDLLDLLCRRIAGNTDVMDRLEFDPEAIDSAGARMALIQRVFPEQVDPGGGKPTTWNWILSRIRDGQDVRPPRNLIDLVEFSRLAQLRDDERDRTEWTTQPLIEREALKRGLSRLSSARVGDTLVAEYPNLQMYFELFRGGKAEQNRASLGDLIGGENGELQRAIDMLVACGFLERIGESWKVPMLYRDGFGITQGKAFAPEAPPADDDA